MRARHRPKHMGRRTKPAPLHRDVVAGSKVAASAPGNFGRVVDCYRCRAEFDWWRYLGRGN